MRNRLLEKLEAASSSHNNNAGGPSQSPSSSSSSSQTNLFLSTTTEAGRLSSSSSSPSSRPQGPPSPGFGDPSYASPGMQPRTESSLSRASRSFKAQSISAVRLRKDKDKDKGSSKKDHRLLLAPALSGLRGSELPGGGSSSSSSAGTASLAMNRQAPTYASMPGAAFHSSTYSQSPPRSSAAMAGPSISSLAVGRGGGDDFMPGRSSAEMGHAQTVGNAGEGRERKLLSRFAQPTGGPSHAAVVAPASAPPHHSHHHHHHHHHHHSYPRGRSAGDDEENDEAGIEPGHYYPDTEDSFFAHLRMECEDCHEILDSDAVLDGRSPRRRANLALPPPPPPLSDGGGAEVDLSSSSSSSYGVRVGGGSGSSSAPIPGVLEDRGGLLLGIGGLDDSGLSTQGRIQSTGSQQSGSTVTSAAAGPSDGASALSGLQNLSSSGTLRGDPHHQNQRAHDEDDDGGGDVREELGYEHEYEQEQEQVLGGFASLGIAPGKSAVDWESSSSSASQGRRSRTNTGPQAGDGSFGPGSAGFGGGGGVGSKEDGDLMAQPQQQQQQQPVDARMSWPTSLRARNADPMETLDILSVEEMGMHSINMGNPDDWEGCIVGPVRPDAPPSSLKFASPDEFCAASAAITWAVARFVGHPRKWIVAPLQALKACDDEHQAACNAERTVVVTDHHVSSLQRSAGLAAKEPNFWEHISGSQLGFSHGSDSGAGGAGSGAMAANSHATATTPFNETTVFELRFLRANTYEAFLSSSSTHDLGRKDRAELPIAPDPAFMLASPDMHRAMAKAAQRSSKSGAAAVSGLMGARAHTVGVNSGGGHKGSGFLPAEGRRETDFGWVDPFVDFSSSGGAGSTRLSAGSGSTKHGYQTARGSASLSVSSGPSSRSASSVVGLGLGGPAGTGAGGSTLGVDQGGIGAMRTRSVVGMGERVGMGMGMSTVGHGVASSMMTTAAPVSIPITRLPPSSHSTIMASSASYSVVQPGHLSSSQATQPGHLLRRVRSKPTLRGSGDGGGASASVSGGAGSQIDPSAVSYFPMKGATASVSASASSSPSLHPSPRMQHGMGGAQSSSTGTATATGSGAVTGQESDGAGAGRDNRRPSLGKSASFESASTNPHPRQTSVPQFAWGGVGTAGAIESGGGGSAAGSGPNSPMLSATRYPPTPAHVELLGLDAVPKRSLTMIIPLPLFQLESSPRPVMRYVRVTFVPFASANTEAEDPSSTLTRTTTNEKGDPSGPNHSSQKHLFQSVMRLPQSFSQSSGLSMMPDDFELPMSPLVTPTATVPPPLNLPPAHAHANAQPQPQSWYRKFAAAAGARALLHPHDDGSTGSFSLGGGSSVGNEGSKDWFKRIGGSRQHDESSSYSPTSPPSVSSPPPSSSSSGGGIGTMSKNSSHFAHDRCRLPGRRRSVAEAFRVTALVLADVPVGSNASMGVTRTASAGSARRKNFQPGSLPLLSATSAWAAGGQGYMSSHVSPRHVQGAAFASSGGGGGGAESPSLSSEAGSTHNLPAPNRGAFHSRGSDSGASITTTSSTLAIDWAADLPEPGTFPVVLAFCDGSRSRSLELVPEGWEAIGLGSGAAALGLPGFYDGAEAEEQQQQGEEDGDGVKDGAIGGGLSKGSRGRSGLPGGALGGVADLILAACSAVMDL